MTSESTSIVYIRRQSDDGLDGIIHLAEQHYASGIADFLIVDLSGDSSALAVLGRMGDPVRYLTGTTSSLIECLLADEPGLARAAHIVVVDDAPPRRLHALALQQRMEFVPRYDFAPSAARAV